MGLYMYMNLAYVSREKCMIMYLYAHEYMCVQVDIKMLQADMHEYVVMYICMHDSM